LKLKIEMRIAVFIFFLVFCWLLFFHRLADRDLWSSHEARAGMDAQTMLDDGAWGLPRLFSGEPELQKPPLYYWLVASIAALRFMHAKVLRANHPGAAPVRYRPLLKELRDLQRAVRHAIATLPPHYRDTVALQVFSELTYDEIARTLDIPLGTVMSRLNAAKRLLREQLGPTFDQRDEANTS